MLAIARARALKVSARRFSTQQTAPVCIDFKDLERGNLGKQIEAAYGFEGLGIITIANVPGVEKLRHDCLHYGHKFAALSEAQRTKYEHPESWFGFGWSHGKEMLGGRPDLAKGSFYANPLRDRPTEDQALMDAFPSYCSPNIWPDDDLPGFQAAFKAYGSLIVATGKLLALHCDAFVASRSAAYQESSAFMLARLIEESRCHKARLLHYYPMPDAPAAKGAQPEDLEEAMSSWCGWHNDHGSLTGLSSSMYVDAEGQEVACPDPAAGLYIKTRGGGVVQALYPASHLAFQIGEAAQIHSGGILQATPHAVRGAQGPRAEGVSRETLAVFMQPMWHTTMGIPGDRTAHDAEKGSTQAFLPPGLPPLKTRWTNGVDFGTFTNRTLEEYH